MFGLLAVFIFDDIVWFIIIAGIGTTMTITSMQNQKKAKKSAEKKQAASKAAGLQSQLDLAGQNLEITKEQMYVQANQRKIEALTGQLKEPRQVTVLKYPEQKTEYSAVQKVNIWIDNLIRGQ